VKRLQFFPWLEPNRLAGGNGNLCSSTRIPPDAGFSRPNIENPKTTQLDAITIAQCFFHGFKDCLYSHFRFSLCDSRSVNDFVDDIELDQAASAEKEDSLAPALDRAET
jgi:hypothetical protein